MQSDLALHSPESKSIVAKSRLILWELKNTKTNRVEITSCARKGSPIAQIPTPNMRSTQTHTKYVAKSAKQANLMIHFFTCTVSDNRCQTYGPIPSILERKSPRTGSRKVEH